jgi:hypothetical protein
MKTFSYNLPNTSIVFPKAIVGPKATIVINHRDGTLFGDWDIYESEARMLAGDLPVGRINKTFAGAEVDALKQEHGAILAQLFGLAKGIGDNLMGAQ